ncbi:Flp pilus assembly protein CpaB [Planomonospora corallina]|uniref:Flp pilus assembly protein CpaB n=1 Tax=Planomonospora corallina TaxID=1806052 RepID=A0ABV8I9S4_9ACTN
MRVIRRLPGRRLLERRRRLLAGVLAALAAACAVTALRPDTSSVTVLAAARDLPGGVLSPGDVRPVALRPGTAPEGALRPGSPVAGRVLTGPVRRGEPLTDVRLLGPGLLAAHGPQAVATPIRVADPGSARLLSPGDVIDVLAATSAWDGAGGGPASARVVAEDVSVLAVPESGPESDSGRDALLVLATTPDQAVELASAQAGGRLSIAITPRGASPEQ